MPFVGAALLPHGSMVLDPERSDLPTGAADLHRGMKAAAALIQAAAPDLIVLHTPHGISLSSSLGVYRGSGATGNALWMGAWENFKVHVEFDDAQASKLLAHFKDAGVDAQGINMFAGDAPIRWAEVVPLWFLRDMLGVKFVILSQGCGGSDGASSKHRGQVYYVLQLLGRNIPYKL